MRETLRLTVAALATLPLLAVLPAAAQDPTTLRVLAHADLQNIDPVWTTAGITIEHGYMIYDKLFEFDRAGKAQPQMADSYTISDDGLVHTITLRDGLKFTNGQPVTAADVIASLKRWSTRDALGQIIASLATDWTAVDDKTVRITLSEPFGLVADALAGARGNPAFIMPAATAATDPAVQITDATGSGPFTFDAATWKPGQTVVYEKNPDYVPRPEPQDFYAGGKVAGFDRVEFMYVPDPNTAMAALLAGEADIWELPPNDLALALQGQDGITVAKGSYSHGVIRPNHLIPPFDNEKARQALLYLVDQKDVLAAAVGDPSLWEECASFFTCGGTYSTDAGVQGVLQADIEKAKQLLAEGGYDGRPIVILDPTDLSDLHAVSLYMAQQLRAAGATVDLQSMDWSTLTSRRAVKTEEGGWNIVPTYAGGLEESSPLTNAQIATSCDKAWFGWPCDEEIEALRAQFRSEPDLAKRQAIAAAIQERAYQVVPYIPYGQFFSLIAYRSDLEGVVADAPMPIYWGITRAAQ